MKNFELNTVEDFLLNDDFARWANEDSPIDSIYWNNWLNTHPEKKAMLEQAKTILQNFKIQPISETEKKSEVIKLLNTINSKIEYDSVNVQQHPKFIDINKRNNYWWAAAAIFLLTVVGLIFFFTKAKQQTIAAIDKEKGIEFTKNLIKKENNTAKQIEIQLEDGSLIKLEPKSSIAYADNFNSGDYRDVYLTGEAFFSVKKDTKHPFRVYTNEIVTKVLGTSFIIRASKVDVKIVVKTGKVSVYSTEKKQFDKEDSTVTHPDEIILTPNQEFTYTSDKKAVPQKLLLKNPEMIVSETADEALIFIDEPLKNIFEKLKKNYGINLLFDEVLLSQCSITADLRNIPFYEKLDLLCKAINAKYEVIDAQVVIFANGCI